MVLTAQQTIVAPQLLYMSWSMSCSVLSCSDRGDSTGAVLGSVDDVPVVVSMTLSRLHCRSPARRSEINVTMGVKHTVFQYPLEPTYVHSIVKHPARWGRR